MNLWRLAKPFLHASDPEKAHRRALWALRHKLIAQEVPSAPVLAVEVFGRRFAHPLGLAAGFDKSAEALEGLARLGFSFVEIGSVTPRPQDGNPTPRLFRLTADRAVINRMGFNNDGAVVVARRLANWLPGQTRPMALGVNLGKNKDSEDAAADYALGVRTLGRFADYLVINVSSPNTAGLRALQSKAALTNLVGRVRAEMAETRLTQPLLLKVAPDLTQADIEDIAEVALAQFDGVIVSNTTVARPLSLRSPHHSETGGLSGRPLFEPSTQLLGALHRATQGRLPLIGVGGIESGVTAYAKIRAGATLLQLYSALIFQGPPLIARILSDLARLLEADGFTNLSDAIGADHRR